MLNKTTIGIAALLVATVLASGVPASEVPPATQAAILLRALAYDRNLVDRAGSDLVLAVVSDPQNKSSESNKRDMIRAFQSLSQKKLRGLTISVVEVPFDDQFAATLAAKGVDVAYLSLGLDEDVAEISAITSELKVPTMSGSRSDVEAGACFGVHPDGGKPKLVVHLASSRSHEMDFPAQLLKLAVVIR